MATRKKASLAIELDDLGRPARPTCSLIHAKLEATVSGSVYSPSNPWKRIIGLLDGTESSKDRTAPSLFLALSFRYSGRWLNVMQKGY